MRYSQSAKLLRNKDLSMKMKEERVVNNFYNKVIDKFVGNKRKIDLQISFNNLSFVDFIIFFS